jgi:hypothetical protein
MAHVAGGADHWLAAGTDASLAGVVLEAQVGALAGRGVFFNLVDALPSVLVADPVFMALIRWGADDRVGASADPVLAGIGLGASVAIAAPGPVLFGWIRALPSGGVADSYVVTGVERCADDLVSAHTDPALADILLGAGIAVVAGRAVVVGPARRAESWEADQARVIRRQRTVGEERTGDMAAGDAGAGLADQAVTAFVVANAICTGLFLVLVTGGLANQLAAAAFAALSPCLGGLAARVQAEQTGNSTSESAQDLTAVGVGGKPATQVIESAVVHSFPLR